MTHLWRVLYGGFVCFVVTVWAVLKCGSGFGCCIVGCGCICCCVCCNAVYVLFHRWLETVWARWLSLIDV